MDTGGIATGGMATGRAQPTVPAQSSGMPARELSQSTPGG